MAKKKQHTKVEYRWFPATGLCGLLGGIVAASEEEALMWGSKELFAEHSDFRLVRVKLEYTLPPKTIRKIKNGDL